MNRVHLPTHVFCSPTCFAVFRVRQRRIVSRQMSLSFVVKKGARSVALSDKTVRTAETA
jgi:hypothetical protein